jgi:hypothetical protein
MQWETDWGWETESFGWDTHSFSLETHLLSWGMTALVRDWVDSVPLVLHGPCLLEDP